MIIQILITGAFILGFLKLADKENVMDFYGSCTIYLVPLVIVGVLDFTIRYFELPAFLHLITFSLFFVIPYLIINAICETYTTKKKVLLSVGVFAIVLVTQVVLAVLIGS
ncbi:hypothetical protein [Catenovulum sediminis]|uniref:Uncharacterized protein n=1 Tax=Catenovulum sediminis TaxID=1740262 RepID=A0ABV1RCU4_9ALTE